MEASHITVDQWRLNQVETKVEQKADKTEVQVVADEVRGLRKILIGFMATISASAILVSYSILTAAVHH